MAIIKEELNLLQITEKGIYEAVQKGNYICYIKVNNYGIQFLDKDKELVSVNGISLKQTFIKIW
jgi:hypothetical protein